MTSTAVWSLIYVVAGASGTFIVLWIGTRMAWLKAGGVQLLGMAGAIQVVSLIPKVGWLIAVVVFFLGATRYLGASALEATYVFLLFLLFQIGLALLVSAG